MGKVLQDHHGLSEGLPGYGRGQCLGHCNREPFQYLHGDRGIALHPVFRDRVAERIHRCAEQLYAGKHVPVLHPLHHYGDSDRQLARPGAGNSGLLHRAGLGSKCERQLNAGRERGKRLPPLPGTLPASSGFLPRLLPPWHGSYGLPATGIRWCAGRASSPFPTA